MPQGDKSSYTGKQRRKADHIAEGYEKRGTPKKEAERRAWATVNKESGGGKKSGQWKGQGREQELKSKGRQEGGGGSYLGGAVGGGEEGSGHAKTSCGRGVLSPRLRLSSRFRFWAGGIPAPWRAPMEGSGSGTGSAGLWAVK